MKISSVFFFRYYLSFLFIFIIESDENTDNREEHHRKKISRRKLPEHLKGYAYIYYVFPRRNPPKTVILVKYY